MKIVNPNEDYHIHSLVFSDGFNTIDEIVQTAGEVRIGGKPLTEIAITDHSQALLDAEKMARKTHRLIIPRWKNIHNNVKVIFGIEADLLNEEGDICDQIDNVPSDFLILSAHPQVYRGNPQKITAGYLKALEKYSVRIKVIGHPCANYFAEFVEIEALTEAANHLSIPLELNCASLYGERTNLEKLDLMLERCELLMVNSDAHTLWELKYLRQKGFDYLKEKGYL